MGNVYKVGYLDIIMSSGEVAFSSPSPIFLDEELYNCYLASTHI